MRKLQILKINNYDYLLKSEDNRKYNLNLQFYYLGNELKEKDCLYVSEKILDENNFYSFGPINSADINIDEDDIIKIILDNKEIYLQRYYG